jgi:hypothetical protein
MRKWGRGQDQDGWSAARATCALTAFMVVAAAGTALAAPASAALAADPAWTIQTSPNATVPGGQLESVSCSSASACTAVGTNLSTSGLNVTLAERWNGTSWQRQSTPNPADNTVPASSPDLLGVSCPVADFCEAVGGYQVSTVGISIADGWNGQAWTSQTFPVPTGSTSAVLTQVSCTSARFCEAVGSYTNSVGESLAFAAGWNGTSWRLQVTPNPAGATLVRMTALSCVSAKFCEAGGNAIGSSGFALEWNGTSWLLQTVPGTAGAGSVSCVSVIFCEMVGSGGGDVWNGSSWSSQPIPSPVGSTSASLSGVSCTTATFCQAVGQYNDSSGSSLSLGATWNGTSWAVQTTPNPTGASFTSLKAVSCAAVAACEAAGEFQLSTPNLMALAESWSGSSWQLQHAIRPAGAASNVLNSVSCVSSVFCEAVGSHPDGSDGAADALAEVWNGTAWKIQDAANPAQASNGIRMNLTGVSCVSVTFCEAVGSSSAAAGGGAEVWNGTTWALQAVPGGNLTSVSCTSAEFCLAAGGDGHVDAWNGISWSAQATAPGFTSLSSVSCASSGACEAIGSGSSGDEAEGWNGTSWSPQATPTPAGGSSTGLSAVSCTSATSCEAVGSYTDSTFQAATLAEAWDGTAWTVQSIPNPTSSEGSSLLGVACTSATSCTAVGQYSVSIPSLTLAEAWNGAAWILQSTPDNAYAGQNILNGVSCGAAQACTAVGVTDDVAQTSATLIETGD